MNEYLKRSIVYVTNKETNPSLVDIFGTIPRHGCKLLYLHKIKTYRVMK
jgi:hypothetical protein